MGVITILSGISLNDVYKTLSSEPKTRSQIATAIVDVKQIGELRAAVFDLQAVGAHLDTLIARGHAEKRIAQSNHPSRIIRYGFYLTPAGETAKEKYAA